MPRSVKGGETTTTEIAALKDEIMRSRAFIDLSKAYMEFAVWTSRAVPVAFVLGLLIGIGVLSLAWWLS